MTENDDQCKGKEIFDEMVKNDQETLDIYKYWARKFQEDLNCFPQILDTKHEIQRTKKKVRRFLFFTKEVEHCDNVEIPIEVPITVRFDPEHNTNNNSFYYPNSIEIVIGCYTHRILLEISENKTLVRFKYWTHPQVQTKYEWQMYGSMLREIVKVIFNKRDKFKKGTL